MHFVQKKPAKTKEEKNRNIWKCSGVTSTQFFGNYRCGQGTWISPWVAVQPPPGNSTTDSEDQKGLEVLRQKETPRIKKRKVNRTTWLILWERFAACVCVCASLTTQSKPTVFIVRKTLCTFSRCQQYSALMQGFDISALLFFFQV